MRHFDSVQVLNTLLKPLNKTSHKGDFAHVMVLEGHERYLGASRLAALAALRVGAGKVSILTKNIKNPHPADLAEFIKEDFNLLEKIEMNKVDSLIIGSGLILEKDSEYELYSLINKALFLIDTIVIDAGALATIKNIKTANKPKAVVICTPHPKEAATLLGKSTEEILKDPLQALHLLASLPCNKNLKIIWLLKGSSSLVHSFTKEIFSFKGNNPLLSTGGSGDILCGSIAGLIKQTASPLDATLLAISLQIASAHLWSKKCERGILPSELCKIFPKLLKRDS